MDQVINESMILINGELPNGNRGFMSTFKMIPVKTECPYNEAFYEPNLKTLFVVSKEKKNNLQKVDKKDVIIEMYYQYNLNTEQDIINFIKMFCSNSHDFDYHKFLN